MRWKILRRKDRHGIIKPHHGHPGFCRCAPGEAARCGMDVRQREVADLVGIKQVDSDFYGPVTQDIALQRRRPAPAGVIVAAGWEGSAVIAFGVVLRYARHLGDPPAPGLRSPARFRQLVEETATWAGRSPVVRGVYRISYFILAHFDRTTQFQRADRGQGREATASPPAPTGGPTSC